MAIGDDFAIDVSGNITHVSGTTNYTVLELHRWLQDLADDAQASVGDLIDITVTTPSERSTDNIITLNAPFNIDDTAAQYLYDGSITQKSGDEIYAGLVVVGAVETGTNLQIWQDEGILTSHWSTGKNADATANILNRIIVKVRTNGADIDGRKIIVWSRELGDTYAEFSVTMALGNNVAAIFTAPDLNNQTIEATIAGWTGITNTEGYQELDIAADGTANEPYYSQWDFGTNSAAEVYERTKWIQRRGTAATIHFVNGDLFRGITHQFNYDGELQTITEAKTGVSDGVLSWGTVITYSNELLGPFVVGRYYTFVGSGAVGKLLYLDDQGTTGTMVFQMEPGSGTPVITDTLAGCNPAHTETADVDTVSGASNTGGSGRVLARYDAGTTGTIWIQLISGSAPADNYVLYQRGTAGAMADVAGASTARTVSPAFFGAYTGSSIIGAFGIGIAPSDGIAADLFTTLAAANVNPPNNQQFQVFGLISGDRVLVTNYDGTTKIDFNQFTLNTSLVGATETAAQMTTSIPADTPQVGVIRVELDNGVYRRVGYSSWATDTFTFDTNGDGAAGSYDFSGVNATAPTNVFIGYIDLQTSLTEESVTLKYSAPRTMFVRVRNATDLIKTYETPSGVTFGTAGGSTTVIRTADA